MAVQVPGPSDHFARWRERRGVDGADVGQRGLTCILVRTHVCDDAVTDFVRTLARDTGWLVCLALDETTGSADVPDDIPRVSITRNLFSQLHLYETPDVCWRCGDYALYAARRQFPEVGYFWMIEPDVRIALGNAGDFFHLFARHPEYDLLATYYGPAGPEYRWTAMMQPFSPQPFKCMFPIVRLSARALDYLLEQRQSLSQTFWTEAYPDGRLRSLEIWPNDEVFTASKLYEAGFLAGDMNLTGIRFYDDTVFSYANPISLMRFQTMPADGRIYHPVLSSWAFLRKVRSMFEHVRRSGPAALMEGLFLHQQLFEDIAAEVGLEESERFEGDVRRSIRELELQFGAAHDGVL